MPEEVEKLKALDAKQTSDERLYAELISAIPEALPDAIIVINRAGDICLVNSRTELMFGYDRSQMIGHKVEMLIPEAFRSVHVHHRDEEFWDDPHPRMMGMGRVLSAQDRDGREIKVEIMLSPLITPHGRFVIALVRKPQKPRFGDATNELPSNG